MFLFIQITRTFLWLFNMLVWSSMCACKQACMLNSYNKGQSSCSFSFSVTHSRSHKTWHINLSTNIFYYWSVLHPLVSPCSHWVEFIQSVRFRLQLSKSMCAKRKLDMSQNRKSSFNPRKYPRHIVVHQWFMSLERVKIRWYEGLSGWVVGEDNKGHNVVLESILTLPLFSCHLLHIPSSL